MSSVGPAVSYNEARSAAVFCIDKSIYSKEAVLKACYWLGKDIQFETEDKGDQFKITAALRVSQPTLDQPKPKKIDEVLPEFFEALIDSELRVQIQSETAAVRELIIAKAFAESGVLEDPPPGTFGDPVSLRESTHSDLVQISEDHK